MIRTGGLEGVEGRKNRNKDLEHILHWSDLGTERPMSQPRVFFRDFIAI